LQIIQLGLGIVVVPTVAEGVVCPNDIVFQRGIARKSTGNAVAPGIISIRTNLFAACVINRNDIPLQVFLEVEGVKGVGCIAGGTVLHADGGAAFVIQVDQQGVVPRLADDLGAVQSVDMIGSVDDLVGANAVGVVGKFDHRAGFLHLLELTAKPGECIPVKGGGVADGIVGDGGRANLGQLIAPGVAILVFFLDIGQRSKGAGGIRVRLFAGSVTAIIVGVYVGLVLRLDILAGKLPTGRNRLAAFS